MVVTSWRFSRWIIVVVPRRWFCRWDLLWGWSCFVNCLQFNLTLTIANIWGQIWLICVQNCGSVRFIYRVELRMVQPEGHHITFNPFCGSPDRNNLHLCLNKLNIVGTLLIDIVVACLRIFCFWNRTFWFHRVFFLSLCQIKLLQFDIDGLLLLHLGRVVQVNIIYRSLLFAGSFSHRALVYNLRG